MGSTITNVTQSDSMPEGYKVKHFNRSRLLGVAFLAFDEMERLLFNDYTEIPCYSDPFAGTCAA